MTKATAITLALCLLALCRNGGASDVGDVTRLLAERKEKLTGIGLVFGLPGTGDGGDFAPAIRPLAQMLGNFRNATSVPELSDVDNVALVALSVTIPAHGARRGDKIDVHVTSIGTSKSLAGGRLFICPLTGPMPGSGTFALAEGPLILEDDDTPTVARVAGGAILEVDLPKHFVEEGRFTLVLDSPAASWTLASNIAKMINDSEGLDGSQWAIVVDKTSIEVTIPPAERARPDSFISRVLRLPVPMIAEEAHMRINERLGTIIISGDVEISPAIISMHGLTISTQIPPQNIVAGPADLVPPPELIRQSEFVPIATPQPSAVQQAKLQDLVSALDQLKVPAEDRIAILKELHATGKLHAKLIIE